MIAATTLTRASRLRQSYIEISRYVRQLGTNSHSVTPTKCVDFCRRPFTSSPSSTKEDNTPADNSAAVEGTTGTWREANDGSRQPQREEEGDDKQGGGRAGLKPSTRLQSMSPEQWTTLFKFERCSQTSSVMSWDALQATRDAPESSDKPHDKHRVKLYGYLTSQRSAGEIDFLQLVDPRLERAVQVILTKPRKPKADADRMSNDQTNGLVGRQDVEAKKPNATLPWEDERYHLVKSIVPHTPVLVDGFLARRAAPVKKAKRATKFNQEASGDREYADSNKSNNTIRKLDPFVGEIDLISHVEITAVSIKPLNSFPDGMVARNDILLPPEKRHLQFRTDHSLRGRIRMRTIAAAEARDFMLSKGFDEVETPVLFKSTPEGAREFIVPTRKRGLAFALPQSPQQYKQVLMASAVPRYFQFARCFRDEDQRADRQPEFTQLDLEMSFAESKDVMSIVEGVLLHALWPVVMGDTLLRSPGSDASVKPIHPDVDAERTVLPRYTYEQAMSLYGSDKPDTRFDSQIHRVESWIPSELKKMLTSLEDPIVEMMKIDMLGADPRTSGAFVSNFLDAPSSATYVNNPAGMPGVAVYDPSRVLSGLASFGHEGAAEVEKLLSPAVGDIIIVQTRPRAPFTGGSTPLGNMRRDIHQSAIAQGLTAAPTGYEALWVTDFPLFSPLTDADPGQGGDAGICSTHHPFTAPKPHQDLSQLFTNPLEVIGDHFDLVINGVEVGGGSRRIHTADMQELIFRDVLKMKPDRIEDFRHLLNALDAGCPPHAGFAFGWDRLMALLTGRSSVRDVIAFPKYTDGEDKFVGSPSPLTRDQLSTYHLQVLDDVRAEATLPQISATASAGHGA